MKVSIRISFKEIVSMLETDKNNKITFVLERLHRDYFKFYFEDLNSEFHLCYMK